MSLFSSLKEKFSNLSKKTKLALLGGLVAIALLTYTCNAGASSSNNIEIGLNNSITLGVVDTKNVNKTINALLQRDKSKEFFIVLNSPGGYVHEGLRLTRLLDSSKNVTCVAIEAASMAFVIFQACEKRVVLKDSVLMQHRIAGGARGTPDEIQQALNVMIALEDMMNKRDSARLGMSLEEFRKRVANDWWLFGSDEILKFKAADSLATISCDKELIDSGRCDLYKSL